jgi:hypothetical protein
LAGRKICWKLRQACLTSEDQIKITILMMNKKCAREREKNTTGEIYSKMASVSGCCCS